MFYEVIRVREWVETESNASVLIKRKRLHAVVDGPNEDKYPLNLTLLLISM